MLIFKILLRGYFKTQNELLLVYRGHTGGGITCKLKCELIFNLFLKNIEDCKKIKVHLKW